MRRLLVATVNVALLVGLGSLATGCAATGTARRGRRAAGGEAQPASIAAKTQGLDKRAGLLTFYVDAGKGRLFLELPAPDAGGLVGEYLYVEGLRTGLGSNPVGLDRGQLGASRVVRLRRVGGLFVMEEPNLRYRALSERPRERAAVRESFASSVLWAGSIIAEESDGRFLVDFTPFVVRDAHDVATRLKSTHQGSFSLDAKRSALDPASCLAFPDNLEFEALLTFAGSEPGSHVRETAPQPQSVSLVQHHSLVRLPVGDYTPRRFDPRAGSFAIEFQDYAADLAAPIQTRWIVRHRLKKVDPTAASSKVVEPIVYYVDRGAPEPIRSALVEGASWWKEAFERAGFEDAFRVELLPEDAHPLDVRYNVIQWVHRSTRGWSYGGGVIDPRTGEMIKGHVSLGSLRVRQDRLLFEGLAGADRSGTGADDDPVQLALARIRQLAAHEVGHTLGLAHNFAASTYGDRASVMDYPAPLIDIDAEGRLDFSRAYAVGVGEWDLQAIRYAYSEFPPGADEAEELAAIVEDGLKKGLLFLTDQDARPPSAAQPRANLWDNGEDPVAALEHTLRVRRIALTSFGEHNVRAGAPLAHLQQVFATVYLHHRYQLEAAVKTLGGLDFRYALRGDGQPPATPIAAKEQRRALTTVLATLTPEALDIPEATLALLVPRSFGDGVSDRELLRSATAPAFDALGACATAADLTVRALLQSERCARLVDFHRRSSELPGLREVLDALISTAFDDQDAPPRMTAVAETVQRIVVDRMLDLAASASTTSRVRAVTEGRLAALLNRLRERAKREGGDSSRDHIELLARDIQRYLEDRIWRGPEGWRPAAAPPGSPIGRPGLQSPPGVWQVQGATRTTGTGVLWGAPGTVQPRGAPSFGEPWGAGGADDGCSFGAWP